MEFFINLKLQIRDDLPTIHTAQLVYLNCQDLCSKTLWRMMSDWQDQKFAKRTGTIKNIEIVPVPILCNAQVQLN